MTQSRSKLPEMIDDKSDGKDVLFNSVRNVKDIMSSDVKTLTLDDTIETCLEIMTDNKIRHIPIVDNAIEKGDDPYFVGIVSQRDVFRQISPFLEKIGRANSDIQALKQPLVQIVTRNPKCASHKTSIQEATSLMVENHVDSLPVLFDDNLVGIVTATDILMLFVRLRSIGQTEGEKSNSEQNRRFVDLLAGNSQEAASVLSSVLGTAEDIMTEDVISLEEHDNLDRVMKVMQKGKFRHVPVVDKKNELVGIISDRDVLRLLPFRKSQRKPQSEVFRAELFDVDPDEVVTYQQVYRIMNRDVVYVQPNCDFHDVVKMLNEMKISCLPVTDENKKLIGIATVTDVMRGLLCAYASFKKSPPLFDS